MSGPEPEPRRRKTPGRRARDVDAAARARAIKIWLYAAGPGGLVGFLGGLYGGGSIWAGLLGAVAAAGGVGLVTVALVEGAGWGFARIHNPSGASTPHRPEYSRAESLVARERFDEAIEVYESFVRERPDVPEPYLAIARLLRNELGRPDEAVRWFKRARRNARLDRKREMLVSREIVETCRDRMGDPRKAAPELARMCERFAGTPTGEWARRELAEVKELIQRSRSEPRRPPGPSAVVLLAFLASVLVSAPTAAQTGASDGEWRHYGADPGHTKYSPLDRIDEDNVHRLEIAWTWTSVDEELKERNPILREDPSFRTYAYEMTPLMVDGVLYATTNLGQIAAIDPTTGETLWSHDPRIWLEGRPAVHGFLGRGLAYWTDGEEARLLYAGGRFATLFSVDARTGEPDPEFGRGGEVDLTLGLGRTIDPRQYTVSSPPLVVGDVVVVGAAMTEGRGRQEAPPGHVRGFDVRTGEQKWIFHTIPRPGEFGHDTWEDDSWEVAGGANVWTLMSADPERGLVYLPVGSPVTDFYGGHRPGDNLFANSLVVLDAETGERAWHFQMVHHTVWDYDPPAAPNLVDITVDGRRIEAVAQVTKQGFTFVFDRATGDPVWPIEERPVPQSTVPGERTSPTQPYPTRPPLFLTPGATEEDVIDFTPELRAEALEIFREHHAGPLYTPPALGTNIVRPGWSGGANWWGAAFDPETGRLYVPSWAHFSLVDMSAPEDEGSDLRIRPRVSDLGGPRRLPLFEPPYSQIAALDLNRGTRLWSVPLGDGPRDHPALQHLDLPPLGNFEKPGGPLLTKSLLFIGQGLESKKLWALDKETGEELWEMDLPARSMAAPITYLAGGKQYVVLAVGGGEEPERLIGLALP